MRYCNIALIACLLLGCGASRSVQKGDKVFSRFEGDSSVEKLHSPGQEETLKTSKIPTQAKN